MGVGAFVEKGVISMNDIRMLTVAAALVLVAAACADDAADTTQPVLSPVTVPSTTTVTTGAAGGEDETTVDDTTTEATEAPEETTDDDTTTTEATEAPEETTDDDTTTTTEPTEAPEETTDNDTTTTTEPTEAPEETTDNDTTTTEATEAPEETTDNDTTTTEATEAPEETTEDEAEEDVVAVEPVEDDTTNEATEAPEEIQPDRVVVWEGVDSEDKCAVAGGVWTDTGCEYWVFDDPADAAIETYWHPRLMDDAYQAVDPETVDADHSESLDTRGTWGIHNYHVFYHYNSLGDAQVQYETMRETMRYGVRSVFTYVTDWVWFPYRYDVSWSDVPNVVAITGTYPLGEQRTLLLHTDPGQRSGLPNIEMPLPLPPPIRPTTPFTQPLWPQFAEILGRDCPPVEEIWDGYGTEVTDPCTLKAVETAVDGMWRADANLRAVAIRDGQALADFLLELESFEDPYENALLGYDSRVGGAILVRDVKWAGQWPGASMISLEWNLNYPRRDYTPEEKEAKDRLYRCAY